jgi:hypothetical protein
LTTARPIDADIRLTGEIKDWQPKLLNRFLYDATVITNNAGLAVAVMAREPDDRPVGVPARPVVSPEDTWRNWQQAHCLFQEPPPAIMRPCLRVVDLPVDKEKE